MLDELFKETEAHMKRCVEDLKRNLGTLRTGKASVNLLDNIQVDAYGSKMPINQLATLSVPEARLISIQPFDTTQISAIEKAIQTSDLGINPTNDGHIIRLPIPPLNEERRREYVKIAKKYGEEAKVAVRGARRDANDHLKKAESASDVSKDEARKGQDRIQKLTDEHVKNVDEIIEAKEKEIMEV